jgi:hypothetical protein
MGTADDVEVVLFQKFLDYVDAEGVAYAALQIVLPTF